jgi:hypothetical protein
MRTHSGDEVSDYIRAEAQAVSNYRFWFQVPEDRENPSREVVKGIGEKESIDVRLD